MKTIRFLFIASLFFLISGCKYFEKKDLEINLIPVQVGEKYQFINFEGEIVINPQFDETSIFRDGLALVLTSGKNKKYGFIDESGTYVVMPNYIEATIFSEEIAYVVSENGPPNAIDKEGKTIFILKDAEIVRIFKEGLSAFCISDTSGKKWGFVDKGGKVAITPQFSNVSVFSEGKCAIQNEDGKWGYIDKEGKIIINPQFDEAGIFVSGKASMIIDEKAGIIDEKGKYFINPQFDNIFIDKNSFLIEQDDKYGWCDDKGKITINPQFDEAFIFNDNKLTPVETDNKWGYIDQEGKIIINMQFDYALPFCGKIAAVLSGEKIGFIDVDGKFVINPQFDDISDDFYYFFHGVTEYNEVQTDFFNVNAISNFFEKQVTSTTFSGISIDSKIKEVNEKFAKTKDDFSKYSEVNELISNKDIITGVAYNLFELGSPWDLDDDYDYYFNESYIPNGYYYTLILNRQAKGKEKLIMNSLENTFKDFKLDKELSTDNIKLLNSESYGVILCMLDGSFHVIIIKKELLLNVFENIKDEAQDLVDYTLDNKSDPYDEEYIEEEAAEEYYEGD
jgi:hypothetical protein